MGESGTEKEKKRERKRMREMTRREEDRGERDCHNDRTAAAYVTSFFVVYVYISVCIQWTHFIL